MKTLTKPAPAKGTSKWRTLAWSVPAGILLLAVLILAAKWLRSLPEVQSFLADFPGETHLPEAR